MLNRKACFTLGALLSVALGVLAAGASGFPSRPYFQSVGVGGTAPANAGSIYMAAATGNDPVLSMYRTNNGVGVGIGRVAASGNNSSGTAVGYGYTQFEISSNTAGAHQGRWMVNTAKAGAISTAFTIDGNNASFAAPSSGLALDVAGASGSFVARLVASSSAGNSKGVLINAGTGSATEEALAVNNQANTINNLRVMGDGSVMLGAPTGGAKGAGTLNAAGTIYVNNVPVPAFRIAAAICDSGTGGSTCTQTVGQGATIAWSSNGGTGVGNYTLTGFTGNPTCQATPVFTGGASRTARINIQSSTAVTTVTETSTTGAAVNSQVNVTCVGP